VIRLQRGSQIHDVRCVEFSEAIGFADLYGISLGDLVPE
jgi:hypothetical protein